MVLATLAFLGAFGANQSLLTYFADLRRPTRLSMPDWAYSRTARLAKAIKSNPLYRLQTTVMLGLKVTLAFGKTLEADLNDVLVRSVANPKALPTLWFRSLSSGFAS